MKILCVAEKPSIAKAVSAILSNGRSSFRRDSVPIYDFSFDFGGSLGTCKVVMTSVRGNVRGLAFPEQYNWGRCDPETLFTAPVISVDTDKSALKIVATIKREARSCDRLMIWTDCDREGESIGYYIFEIAKEVNSRLTVASTLRAHFSHLGKAHILQAARNPRAIDMRLVHAARARAEIDIRLGFAFTRLLTTALGSLFAEKKTLSYGLCQFPTLGFVVDRYIRVREFIPEPFWHIHLVVLKKNSRTDFLWTKPSLFDRAVAVALFSRALELGKEHGKIVAKVEKPTSNYKPLPLTTVELQKTAARVFKMTAKAALSAAEDLYNKGFISYPRTETDLFPASMDLKKLISDQTPHPDWGSYAQDLLAGKYCAPRRGKNSDEAHPPIHPVKYTNGQDLDQKTRKIYELVVRHFLACCSDDAKGNRATATLEWGEETFTASTLEVTERNYLDVYGQFRTWKSLAKKMPPFSVGETVKIFLAELKEGKTSPPEYMRETELIALMDANGIGTDATIAEHISKVQEREYVKSVRSGNKTYLIPLELGMGLVLGFDKIEFNDNLSLTKPFLRKDVEQSLQEICEGKITKSEVLQKMNLLYHEAYAVSARNKAVLVRSYQSAMQENGE